MAADSTEIIAQMEQLRDDFQALSALVTGAEAQIATATDREARIFRAVLALGRQLLALFFTTRAARQPVPPEGYAPSDCRLRPTSYLSVFGKIAFRRHRLDAPVRLA